MQCLCKTAQKSYKNKICVCYHRENNLIHLFIIYFLMVTKQMVTIISYTSTLFQVELSMKLSDLKKGAKKEEDDDEDNEEMVQKCVCIFLTEITN